jgi:hypothetical protein
MSTSDFFDNLSCPVCSKPFKTKRGCTSHLRNASSCSWYRQEKLAELQPLDLEGEGGPLEILDDIEGLLGDGDQWEVLGGGMEVDPEAIMDEIEDDDDLFHFIPLPSTPPASIQPDIAVGEPGPGPSTTAVATATANRGQHRILDDDDDSRVEDVFPGAGSVFRMNENLHERWMRIFDSEQDSDSDGDVRMEYTSVDDTTSFHPFASELDWQVANWVIKENVGHKAFDRFLAIPGVCVAFF